MDGTISNGSKFCDLAFRIMDSPTSGYLSINYLARLVESTIKFIFPNIILD